MPRIALNQRGSASLMALMTMIILSALTSIYLATSSNGLSRITGFNYGEAEQAKAAAEAGIRYAWMNAVENTDQNYKWDMDKLIKTEIHVDSADDHSPTFAVTVNQITTNLPSGLQSGRDSYYRITSVGRAGNSRVVTEAYLVRSNPVSLTQLVTEGDVSNGAQWTVDEKKGEATAPGNKDYYQILFNMDYDSARDGITYHYKINLKNITDQGASGYGIYYLAQGNPNNMSGYVLQYDTGLSPDQIIVKKVVADKKDTTRPELNEVQVNDDPNAPNTKVYSGYNYSNESWQATTTAASWSSSYKAGSWKDPKTLIANQTASNPAINSFIPLEAESSDTYLKQDIMSVPMDIVKNQLNKIKANNTSSNKMMEQEHILTINLQPVTAKDGKQYFLHRIYIDGLEILRFVDRSTENNFAKQPGRGRTGLRVWSATAVFSNLGDLASATKIRSWEIVKP